MITQCNIILWHVRLVKLGLAPNDQFWIVLSSVYAKSSALKFVLSASNKCWSVLAHSWNQHWSHSGNAKNVHKLCSLVNQHLWCRLQACGLQTQKIGGHLCNIYDGCLRNKRPLAHYCRSIGFQKGLANSWISVAQRKFHSIPVQMYSYPTSPRSLSPQTLSEEQFQVNFKTLGPHRASRL